MDNAKKLQLLEETLDVEAGTLSPEMELDSIDEYDSMTKLSIIVMFDDEFGKKLTGEMIRTFVTVSDIMRAMD